MPGLEKEWLRNSAWEHEPCVSTASSRSNTWRIKVSETSSGWALRCSSEQDSWCYEKIWTFHLLPESHQGVPGFAVPAGLPGVGLCGQLVFHGESTKVWGEGFPIMWHFMKPAWTSRELCFCSISGDWGEKGLDVLLVWREAAEELPLELEPMLAVNYLAVLNYFT